MTTPEQPGAEALRAAADQRIRQQIHDHAGRRRRRRRRRATTRAALNATRNAGLAARHQTRLTYLTNHTPAATAA